MANCHIAHDCVVGDHTILANGVILAGHVTVEDWAILGGYVAVHQFSRLGEHCFVGGGSEVERDIAPWVMSDGHPAQPRGINKEGLRRRGFKPDEIEAIEDLYKLVFRSEKLMADVKKELARRLPHGPISPLLSLEGPTQPAFDSAVSALYFLEETYGTARIIEFRRQCLMSSRATNGKGLPASVFRTAFGKDVAVLDGEWRAFFGWTETTRP